MRLWGLVPLIDFYLSAFVLYKASAYDGTTGTDITNTAWDIYSGQFWLNVYNSFISYFVFSVVHVQGWYPLLTFGAGFQALAEFAAYSNTRISGIANSTRNYPAEGLHILNFSISAYVFFWTLVYEDPFVEQEWNFECFAPVDYADRSEEEFGIFNEDHVDPEDPEVRRVREQAQYEEYQQALKNAEAPDTLV
jgi:hypothetical protein